MSGGVHILAAGARTPLGGGAAPSAAAVRAGLRAVERHPFLVDQVGDLLPAAVDAELDPHLYGAARLLELARPALAEAVAPLRGAWPVATGLPLFVGLPEVRPGFTEQDAAAVRSGLASCGGGDGFKPTEVHVYPRGHAAGVVALAAAVEHLRSAAGACVVGGVDSYFHPDTVEWLDANRQIANSVSRSGFVPGEGAAFILLATEAFQARAGLKPLAELRAVAMGREDKRIKTDEMCLGEGLTATVRDAVAAAGLDGSEGGRVGAVVCDINGERYRSEEWGFVCLRLSRYFDDVTAYRSPAEFWGDVGAASAPLFAMLVCQAVARGYSEGSRTMLFAGSEGGDRGAAVLETRAGAAGAGAGGAPAAGRAA